MRIASQSGQWVSSKLQCLRLQESKWQGTEFFKYWKTNFIWGTRRSSASPLQATSSGTKFSGHSMLRRCSGSIQVFPVWSISMSLGFHKLISDANGGGVEEKSIRKQTRHWARRSTSLLQCHLMAKFGCLWLHATRTATSCLFSWPTCVVRWQSKGPIGETQQCFYSMG